MSTHGRSSRARERKPLQRTAEPSFEKLVGSEPHYIPGYKGFVPGKRDQIALTYAASTKPALASRPPSRPGSSSSTYMGSSHATLPEVHSFDKTLSLDQGKRIPGYTGYVPAIGTTVGKTYGEATQDAVQNAITNLQIHEYQQIPTEIPSKPPTPTGRSNRRPITPSTQSASPLGNRSVSPENQNIAEWPPGYTGFIPNSQYHYGKTYGNLVKKSENIRLDYTSMKNPESFDEGTVRTTEAPSSHIPGYTGFIMENKDDFGKTYGALTKEHVEIARQGHAEPPKKEAVEIKLGPAEKRAIEANIVLSDAAHIPGYGGTISGWQNRFGGTYGVITKEAKKDIKRENTSIRHSSLDNKSPVKSTRVPGYTGYLHGSKFEVTDSRAAKKITEVKGVDIVEQTVSYSSEKEIDKSLSRLGRKPSPAPIAKRVSPDIDSRNPSPVPGYTGYVARSKEYVGQTYGNVTRSHAISPIPPTPNVKPNVGHIQGKGHIPGYGGFVPGLNHDYGHTFHTLTEMHTRNTTPS